MNLEIHLHTGIQYVHPTHESSACIHHYISNDIFVYNLNTLEKPTAYLEMFLRSSIVFFHHKCKEARLLLPKVEFMSCRAIGDLRKLGNFRKISKLNADIASCPVSLPKIKIWKKR